MATLQEALQAVQNEATVDASIITLLTNIKAQLDAATTGALTTDQQAAVDSIFSTATANIAAISNAVTANTPAAPVVNGAGSPATA